MLEKGNADKKFADEVEQVQYKKMLASAKTVAVNDRKTLTTLEASAGKSGEYDAQLGVALASYGQYDKAAQLLQSAVTKGGVKRLDQAQIVLGYSLLQAQPHGGFTGGVCKRGYDIAAGHGCAAVAVVHQGAFARQLSFRAVHRGTAPPSRAKWPIRARITARTTIRTRAGAGCSAPGRQRRIR